MNDDEDVVFEDSDDEGIEKGSKDKLKELRERIKELEKEKSEYLTGWQKERADFANYKKDEDARRASASGMMREGMLSRFLSVMDSFNMAFANKEVWEKVDANWRKGVEYIYSQMYNVFEEYGVREIGMAGEKFDPSLHHSIELVPTDQKDRDHTIAAVIQKGYKLGDRILRPAGVNVYEYKG